RVPGRRSNKQVATKRIDAQVASASWQLDVTGDAVLVARDDRKLSRRIRDNVQAVTARSRCASGNRLLERNVSASNERAGIETDEGSATSSQIDSISEPGARARGRVR